MKTKVIEKTVQINWDKPQIVVNRSYGLVFPQTEAWKILE